MATRRTRLTIVLASVAIVVGGGGYIVYWEYFSEAHALAKRMDARRRWLEIAAAGRAQNGSMDDAKVLFSCFKIGEPISNVAAILATGEKQRDLPDEFGRIAYDWWFVVPKPPSPDATTFVFTVYVDTKKEPPVIDSFWDWYTVD